MHSNNASFLVKSSLQSSTLNHKKIKLLLSNVEFKPKPTKNRATFSKEIIRGQLEDIAAKLNIKSPLEWEKVSTRQVRDVGGLELLTSHGGLRKVLQIAYSGTVANLFPLTYRCKLGRNFKGKKKPLEE